MHVSTFASKVKVFSTKNTSPTRRASRQSPTGKKLEEPLTQKQRIHFWRSVQRAWSSLHHSDSPS